MFKLTKFGGVPNVQGAHAVSQLGKPSFKKEKLITTVKYNILTCTLHLS